jgi:hypothetical protein
MEQTPAEPQEKLFKLLSLLKDSSKDVYGPYVPGRGEFAPRWQGITGLVELGAVAVEPAFMRPRCRILMGAMW